MKKILISCAPKSGAKFIMTILRALGVNASHERYFNNKTPIHGSPIISHSMVEIAWESALYLQEYSKKEPDTIIINLIRNPFDCVNSMIRIKFFPTNNYFLWAGSHNNFPKIRENQKIHNYALDFWLKWNYIIEGYSQANIMLNGNITKDLFEVLKMADYNYTLEQIKAIIDKTPKNLNSWGNKAADKKYKLSEFNPRLQAELKTFADKYKLEV